MRGNHQDLSHVIDCMAELRDLENGVFWIREPKDAGKTHDLLIRDARQVVDNPINRHYSLMMISINAARSAIKMLDIEKEKHPEKAAELEQQQAHMLAKVDRFLEHVHPAPENAKDITTMFNIELVRELRDNLGISHEECVKRINKTKDFMNFDDPTKHLITVDKIPGKTEYAIQADIPVTGLTKEIFDEYNNLQEKEWFLALPDWQQDLVMSYREKIQSGEYVIPTQLRDCLPGIRNAYIKATGIATNNNTKVLDCSYHSGTLAFLGKCNNSECERITRLNIEQVKEHSKTDIHAITFNARLNFSKGKGSDRTIVSRVEKASNGSHSNLCANSWRKFSANDFKGVKDKLSQARGKIDALDLLKDNKKLQQDIQNYLSPRNSNPIKNFYNRRNSSKRKDKIISQLETILAKSNANNDTNAIYQIGLIAVALECKHLINSNSGPLRQLFDQRNDKKNSSIAIATYTSLLDDFLEDVPGFKETVSACASGKDRCGIFLNDLSINAVARYFDPLMQNTEQNKNLVIQFAREGHQAFTPSRQGGTTGPFGVKSDSLSSVHDEYGKEVSDLLIQKEASYNKKVPGVSKNAAKCNSSYEALKQKHPNVDFTPSSTTRAEQSTTIIQENSSSSEQLKKLDQSPPSDTKARDTEKTYEELRTKFKVQLAKELREKLDSRITEQEESTMPSETRGPSR